MTWRGRYIQLARLGEMLELEVSGVCLGMDILTVSANQERDEEPCSRTEQMECVH